jgi:DNA-binding GntR family transcriptional regulator
VAVNSKEQPSVYHSLRGLIFSGKILPGERVVEKNVAQQLGVSHVPIREAVAKLMGQGLLVRGDRGERGWVRDYSLEEVRQLFEFCSCAFGERRGGDPLQGDL